MRYIILLIIVVILGIAGIAIYISQQATEQPQEAQKLKVVEMDVVNAAAPAIEKRVKENLEQDKITALNAAELQTLILYYMQHEAGIDVPQVVHGSHVGLSYGRLQFAFNIDVNKVVTENMPEDIQRIFSTLQTMVTDNDLSNVYFAVDGMPQLRGDVLSFGENANLQVGLLKYETGSSREGIVNAGIHELNRWSIDTVYVENEQLVLAKKNHKNSFE